MKWREEKVEIWEREGEIRGRGARAGEVRDKGGDREIRVGGERE